MSLRKIGGIPAQPRPTPFFLHQAKDAGYCRRSFCIQHRRRLDVVGSKVKIAIKCPKAYAMALCILFTRNMYCDIRWEPSVPERIYHVTTLHCGSPRLLILCIPVIARNCILAETFGSTQTREGTNSVLLGPSFHPFPFS